MALIRSYAIWNNKGGVGKSTITFHLAARYAEEHPDADVLVVDLCPQANSSMMLLGGGVAGENVVLNCCTQAIPRTVVGYLSQVIANGAGAALPDPGNFVQCVHHSNPHLTNNLYLLCGDGNLELMAPAIVNAANAPVLTPTVQPWRWVHLIIRSLIDDLVARRQRDLMVFIDTNPSFSIYTELAVSAANRIITPVNADDSSRVATNAMFILLHGQNPPHPIYGAWTYARLAAQYGLIIPQIHLIVGNRLTQHEGAATAFAALSDATADTLYTAYRNHRDFFTARQPPPTTLDEFRRDYSVPLRDFNTAGVVTAHLGRRLSAMAAGNYQVHHNTVQINKERIRECLTAVDSVVAKID